MRRLPVSLIAAALPSSCQESSKVAPIATSASASTPSSAPTSVVDSLRGAMPGAGVAASVAPAARRPPPRCGPLMRLCLYMAGPPG